MMGLSAICVQKVTIAKILVFIHSAFPALLVITVLLGHSLLYLVLKDITIAKIDQPIFQIVFPVLEIPIVSGEVNILLLIIMISCVVISLFSIGVRRCRTCGSSTQGANSNRTSCVCTGQNRRFSPTDGACICQSGYVFVDTISRVQVETDGVEDCQIRVCINRVSAVNMTSCMVDSFALRYLVRYSQLDICRVFFLLI
jgi:hypothetical protein